MDMNKKGFTPHHQKATGAGFTLIELLIVVAIIGILAAVSIPAYLGQQKRAARSEAWSNLESLRLLEEQYYAENACYYRTGGACANDSDIPYNGTPSTADGGIEDFLPGFQPGSGANFTYKIEITTAGTITAGCFTATATGASSRVSGETYTIDCNNTKNF